MPRAEGNESSVIRDFMAAIEPAVQVLRSAPVEQMRVVLSKAEAMGGIVEMAYGVRGVRSLALWRDLLDAIDEVCQLYDARVAALPSAHLESPSHDGG